MHVLEVQADLEGEAGRFVVLFYALHDLVDDVLYGWLLAVLGLYQSRPDVSTRD